MSDPLPARRRVLLDENLPRQLAGELPRHDVATVRTQGWTGVVNGDLLRLAEEAGFEVFVTGDRIWNINRRSPREHSAWWWSFPAA
ncbi:MAG TPA: DUF5615 family PIN-like protein [Longimicrobium sp.]|nr:DUF5615 family PIN-like protein [Longimicrobium sp.]